MNPTLVAQLELQQFYARQSLAIDGGDATGWASTFTADGTFDSPTYTQPVQGAEALTEFARIIHRDNSGLHHVVANVLVEDAGDSELTVRANLLIVTTQDFDAGLARIDRITTIHDRFRREPELLLHHRRVLRDGQQTAPSEGAKND